MYIKFTSRNYEKGTKKQIIKYAVLKNLYILIYRECTTSNIFCQKATKTKY